MKKMISTFLPVFVLFAISAIDGHSQRNNRSQSTDSDGGFPRSCSDLRTRFDDRASITDQSQMSLAPSQAPLKAQVRNGGIYLEGWDRNEISVTTCKAVPDDQDATGKLREINTVNQGGQLTITGPASGNWTASLIIMVPRLTNLSLEAVNGPLSLRDMAGSLQLSARNGPVNLNNIGGVVDVTATNGPVNLNGVSGDQKVNATNGPINLVLSGTRWDGPGLELSAKNGPVNLRVPDGFSSGIQVQTNSDRIPVNCKISACSSATKGSGGLFRLGSGDPVVRLSSQNGPVSIQ